MTFPKPPSAPRGPATKGSKDPKTQIYNILREANEKQKRRQQKPVKFHGVVLYTAIIDYDTFSQMYDDSFVNLIYNPASNNNNSSKPLITSSIVFIEDLCSCLPPIKDPKFFEEIAKFTSNNLKKEKSSTKSRSIVNELKEQLNIKGNQKYVADFNRILRYPIAYCLKDSVQNPGAMDTVVVEFPREYDFSKCKIIHTTSQKQ